MLQYPAESAPPIAWEQERAGFLSRYFGTLASVYRPIATAPAFIGGAVRPAARFALLTALPAALIAGILPHTRTLFFQHLQVHIVGTPSTLEIALDVISAMLLEGALALIRFGCLFFPFVSLVRAYAAPDRHFAAMRMLFYRAWVLPAVALLYYYGAIWPLSASVADAAEVAPASFVLCGSVTLALLMLLLSSMSATARIACGLGPWMSTVVVMVPVTLLVLVEDLLGRALAHVLPAVPMMH